MPMPTLTPQMVLQEQYRKLQSETKAKEAALPKSDPEAYAQQIAVLQKDFDTRKAKIFSQGEQFDQIDMMVQAGLMDPQVADSVKWRMVLPADIAKNMVQPEPQGTPMAPGTLTSKPMSESITGHAQAATMEKPWFSRNYYPQDELIKQYQSWREFVGYDARPPVQQQQLDYQWDAMLAGDKKYKWNPKSPEVAALRAKGPIAKAAAAQVMPGTPMAGIPKTSPFIAHIAEQKPEPQLITVQRPDGEPVEVPANEWQQQRAKALSEGWKEI